VLDRLKPDEAEAVLHRLLAAHPRLREEARQMARDLLDEVSFEDVAAEIEWAARQLDLDALNSRAGRHRWGYKDPTDAAWELLDEVVEPFLEDMKRQAEVRSAAAALEICKGVVLGLYALRHRRDGDTVLGWAPDYAVETAMRAVEMCATGGGGTWKLSRAGRSLAALPDAFVESCVPEWRAVIAQTVSRSRRLPPRGRTAGSQTCAT